MSAVARPRKPRSEVVRESLLLAGRPWMRVLQAGDLLLYRADNTLADLAIADAGRGPWCHAAMLDFYEGQWSILETLQHCGGRRMPLADAVAKNPGHWDLFSADPDNRWPEFNRYLAIEKMRQFVGMPYGWAGLARLALARLPVLGRLLWPVDTDDDTPSKLPPFCSQAVSAAYRGGGIDPVPHLADAFTEPSDLGRSMFFQYTMTLVP